MLSHNNMIALKLVLSTWLEEAEVAKRDLDGSSGVLPHGEKNAMVVLLPFFSPAKMTPLLPSGSHLAAPASTNQLINTILRHKRLF